MESSGGSANQQSGEPGFGGDAKAQALTKEEVAEQQAKADELRKQIELNQEYEEKLKAEIVASTPFVSDLMDLGVLKEEYAENKFENCFD
jgi:ubiquitin thioesterase protein OTUB1